MDTSIEVVTAPGEGTPPAEVDSQGGDAKSNGNKKPALPKKELSGRNAVPSAQQALAPRARKGGGPRTTMGKERSRRNAVKHGILAQVAVVLGEPFSKFDSLLQGLRNDFQPEGTLENMLVEKLASLGWRYRRMLLTENEEIRIGMLFGSLAAERKRQRSEEAVRLFASIDTPGPGLYSKWENPIVQERIVDLLASLAFLIEIRGFDRNDDIQILKTVFGDRRPTKLAMVYMACSNLVNPALQKGYEEFDLPPAERKAKFLEILKAFIASLEHSISLEKNTSERRELMESLCSGVPEAPRLDRILRYEASLDRAFDRTLNQLERLQRIRRGQPVLPPIKIETT